jgi:hypothetical protein
MGKDKGKDKQLAGGTPQLNVMADGSYSWSQPSSNGLGGWEGFCGQTAIANLLTTHQGGTRVTPHDVSQAADDWTPGSSPGTLMRAIGKLSRNASNYERTNDGDLSAASAQNPIVCLLNWEGTTYHYVSVVGRSGDRVIFNHWGMQDSLQQDEFMRRWAFRGGGIGAGVVARLGGLRGNTAIRRK